MNALRCTYADIKTVRTRKVFQIVFEGPIEQMGEAMALFGPPLPDAEVWAAIARLRPPEKIELHTLAPLSQVAGILSGETSFHRWLEKTGNVLISDAHEAAAEIRKRCEVGSRRELDSNAAAGVVFRAMRTDYQLWLREAA